jgi:PTH1 family peptidyl-tRNA hydrolase
MFWKRKQPSAGQSGGGINFIICGLGNPGSKYENTRHNCGFMAVDDLAKKHGVAVKRLKFKSLTGEVTLGGVKCLLMKPSTYMNKSGEAVAEAMRFYKLPPNRVLALCDDINLDVGVIRIREKGSDGGQKGIRSIILESGSDEFPRIKIGVGAKPHPDYKLEDWVLSMFLKSEASSLEFALANAIEAAEMVAVGELIAAANKFNGARAE